ncbi:hypothetical protein PUV54_13110 [Hyphococcus flavus]|uniref:Uncharacterized protein n=1 Tax=Hyphococcus flavus TaxID=1866326 RepID=A0AAE9ZAT6_9PROT|nr:hypothetical protein [Hyphococcus flavus]WDI30893.1 hypothetical protein PUV54_13110 [Hyphococcus flavus]
MTNDITVLIAAPLIVLVMSFLLLRLTRQRGEGDRGASHPAKQYREWNFREPGQ